MREIITLHFGQAGVQIGNSCWQLYALQHGLDQKGKPFESTPLGNPHKIYQQNESGSYSPRTAYLDLEPIVIEESIKSPTGGLLDSDQLFYGKQSASNIYALGFYNLGEKYQEECMNTIRKQMEKCDMLQGLIMAHSVVGGTGSGLAMRILDEVKHSPKTTVFTLTLFESPQFGNPVSPYNCVLASNILLQKANACILFDNESLYNTCKNKLNIESPNYENTNKIIAQVASSVHSSNRFQTSATTSLWDLETNLIPYHRLHFLQPSFSPLISEDQSYHYDYSVSKITSDLFDYQNRLLAANPRHGKYMSCSALYRGDVNISEALVSMNKHVRHSKNIYFIDWCPTVWKVGVGYGVPKVPKHSGMAKFHRSGCLLSNNQAIAEIFSRTDHRFDLLYAKRAFTHWYDSTRMEGFQFSVARENIAALEKDFEPGFFEDAYGEEEEYQYE